MRVPGGRRSNYLLPGRTSRTSRPNYQLPPSRPAHLLAGRPSRPDSQAGPPGRTGLIASAEWGRGVGGGRLVVVRRGRARARCRVVILLSKLNPLPLTTRRSNGISIGSILFVYSLFVLSVSFIRPRKLPPILPPALHHTVTSLPRTFRQSSADPFSSRAAFLCPQTPRSPIFGGFILFACGLFVPAAPPFANLRRIHPLRVQPFRARNPLGPFANFRRIHPLRVQPFRAIRQLHSPPQTPSHLPPSIAPHCHQSPSHLSPVFGGSILFPCSLFVPATPSHLSPIFGGSILFACSLFVPASPPFANLRRIHSLRMQPFRARSPPARQSSANSSSSRAAFSCPQPPCTLRQSSADPSSSRAAFSCPQPSRTFRQSSADQSSSHAAFSRPQPPHPKSPSHISPTSLQAPPTHPLPLHDHRLSRGNRR